MSKEKTDQPEAVEAVSYSSQYAGMRYPAAPHGPIQFENGQYTTDNPDEIAYLDARDTCERD